jgi:hypothetical protein
MTMTLDTTQQRFGHALNFDYSAHSQPPAFSNPWSSSSPAQSAPASSGLFVGSQPPAPLSHSMMASKAPNARTSASSTSSLSSYGSLPIAAPSSAAEIPYMNRMHTTSAAYGDPVYATSASPVNGHFAPASGSYDPLGYASAHVRQATFGAGADADPTRRYSQA